MSGGTYAAKTDVPVSRSRDEIEKILQRYGATGFGYMTQGQASMVVFEARSLRIMFRVSVPDPQSREMRYATNGRELTKKEWEGRVAQVERQRWRALALVIKAKLEAIDSGIETFEQAFLAHIMVPSTGQTYGEMAIPAIAEVYQHQELPPLVPALPGAKVIELSERSGT